MATEQPGHAEQPQREFNVTCFADENRATFICTNCQRPYCDQCLGKTIENDKYCLECSALEQVRRSAPQKRQQTKKSSPALLTPALIVLALLLTGINFYLLFDNDYITVPTTSEPDIPPALSELVECKHNLQHIAATAASFKESTGSYPVFIEQLQPFDDKTALPVEPITGMDYLIEKNEAGEWSVHCPSPEKHGVSDIVAIPGKPARLIYLSKMEVMQ